jgi:translation initiation factor 3 subunit A
MEIERLLELVKPLEGTFEGAFGKEQVEAYLMSCARRGDLKVKVDHMLGCVVFLDEAFAPAPGAATGSTSAVTLDKAVQPSVNELVRTRVSAAATCLHNALLMIDPPQPVPAPIQQEKIAQLVASANAERHALQLRRAIVARRRELLSELSARKEKEEMSRRAEALRREKEEEGRRALEAVRRREAERKVRELENVRKEEARKLAMSLKEKGTLKVDLDVSFGSFALSVIFSCWEVVC